MPHTTRKATTARAGLLAASLASLALAQAPAGKLDVDAGPEFAPTFWTLRFDVPVKADWRLDHLPFLQCQRREGERWVDVQGPPGDPNVPAHFEQNGYQAPASGRRFAGVPLAPGRTFRWQGELLDWRVLGYPGRYRLRCRWHVDAHAGFAFTDWVPFAVAPGTCQSLRDARRRDDATWRAYRAWISRAWQPKSAARFGAQAIAALDDLPDRLRRRLQLASVERLYLQALTSTGAARQDHLAQLRATATRLGHGQDHYAQIASSRLVAAHERQGAQAWRSEARELWADPAHRGVAVAYPALRDLLERAVWVRPEHARGPVPRRVLW